MVLWYCIAMEDGNRDYRILWCCGIVLLWKMGIVVL